MSNLGTSLRTVLAANAGVTALVGGAGASARIHPQVAPQKTALPYVTYYVASSTEKSASLDGLPAALEWARVTFDCWAEKYADAAALEKAIRLALDGYAGTPAGGVKILACRRIDRRELYEPDAIPKALYRAGADYLVNAEI